MYTFEAMISLLTSHVWWWIIPADNNHFPYFLHWYFWVSAFFRQIHLHWPKLTMKNPPFYSLYSPVIHVFSHSYNHLSIPLNIPLYHPTISSHYIIPPPHLSHIIPPYHPIPIPGPTGATATLRQQCLGAGDTKTWRDRRCLL
jgi:hypothetical protein